MSTITVTLHDEGARRALLFALWRRASDEIGETFYSALALQASEALRNPSSEHMVVDEEIALLRSTMAGVERVSAAAVGESVTLDTPPGALAHGLSACVAYIAENEGFWLMPVLERERELASHDGAVRLLADLEKMTEGVA